MPPRRFMQFWGRKSYDSYPHNCALLDPPHTLIQTYKRGQARCIVRVLILARWAYCAGQGLMENTLKRVGHSGIQDKKAGSCLDKTHTLCSEFSTHQRLVYPPLDLIERVCRAHVAVVGVFVVFTLYTTAASTLETRQAVTIHWSSNRCRSRSHSWVRVNSNFIDKSVQSLLSTVSVICDREVKSESIVLDLSSH